MAQATDSGGSAHLFHFTAAKAGMDGLDRDYINRVIHEASKDSAYFQQQQRRDAAVDVRIASASKLLSQASDIELQTLSSRGRKIISDAECHADRSRTWAVVDMDQFRSSLTLVHSIFYDCF
jgi:DNA polymerase kappa